MDIQKKQNIKISGIGSVQGGQYEDIKINGVGNIMGDIQCRNMSTSGKVVVKGNIKSNYAKFNGICTIDDSITIDELCSNGKTSTGGEANIKRFKNSGVFTINKNFIAEIIKNNGQIKIMGDCTSEEFVSKGMFVVGGLLNSENINIEMYGSCKAKEIGGETINVSLGQSSSFKRFIKSLISTLNDELIVDSIEGNSIKLVNTKTKIVCGNDIIIGDGCEIDLIEYKNSLEVSENSIIKKSVKIE
jgi:cytoskeletal protein CcmA (bactofilin family)